MCIQTASNVFGHSPEGQPVLPGELTQFRVELVVQCPHTVIGVNLMFKLSQEGQLRVREAKVGTVTSAMQ